MHIDHPSDPMGRWGANQEDKGRVKMSAYQCYCCGRFVFDWATVLLRGKNALCRGCRNDPRPPETCQHGERAR
jgi:hypothetical protein